MQTSVFLVPIFGSSIQPTQSWATYIPILFIEHKHSIYKSMLYDMNIVVCGNVKATDFSTQSIIGKTKNIIYPSNNINFII